MVTNIFKNYKDKNIVLIKSNFKYTKNLSNYWKKRIKNPDDFLDIFSSQWFGALTKYNIVKHYLKYLIYIPCYGIEVFFSKTFKRYNFIKKKNNLDIDQDSMRHVLAYEFLNKKLDTKKIKKICIIGDGRVNGLMCLMSNYPKAKYFLINVAHVMLSEYLLIKRFNLFPDKQIYVAQKNILKKNKKLTLILSHQKKVLLKEKIDLFIDMHCMQEMRMSEIKNYFEIMKKSKSYFYTINRKKKYIGNSQYSEIDKYPFGKAEKIIDELCDMNNKYASFKFPFIHKRDPKKPIKHILAKF